MTNAWSTVWFLETTRQEGRSKSLTVYATYEGARQGLADYCYDHWNDHQETAGFHRPEEDQDSLIEMYFRLLEGLESYRLEGRTVHP